MYHRRAASEVHAPQDVDLSGWVLEEMRSMRLPPPVYVVAVAPHLGYTRDEIIGALGLGGWRVYGRLQQIARDRLDRSRLEGTLVCLESARQGDAALLIETSAYLRRLDRNVLYPDHLLRAKKGWPALYPSTGGRGGEKRGNP